MNKLPIYPFTHLPIYAFTKLPSTLVEDSLQISSFLTNKANFRKSQMNVNPYNTTDYENKSNWTLGENEPNTNPIRTQTNPILSAVGGFQMSVNSILTKDYERNDIFAVPENKANSNPIPPPPFLPPKPTLPPKNNPKNFQFPQIFDNFYCDFCCCHNYINY